VSSEPDFSDLIEPFRVTNGSRFRLADVDCGSTGNLGSESKAEARRRIDLGRERLGELQEKLYAQDRWALLAVFQALDAAGKDGAIKHVMSGIDPTGCQVHSFKRPTEIDLDHDYLWRHVVALPERGRIGIFNRSWYEEVLVVRVHPEVLAAQKLPQELVTKRIWQERLEDIRSFERYLGRNGIVVVKFFLHVSRDEQRRRFLKRLEEPDKNWKFSPGDVAERAHWDDYMRAYEEAIRATATPEAPWYVVPADNKWFTRLVIVHALVDALQRMEPAFPKVDGQLREAYEAARRELLEDER
jgi:PPK2 family polyphosphate:nucleotide phosphotransferase